MKVVEFAEAHASEIRTFTADLEEKRGKKRIFQLLPPHLRRRSMSHSIKRVPKSMRKRTLEEVNITS